MKFSNPLLLLAFAASCHVRFSAGAAVPHPVPETTANLNVFQTHSSYDQDYSEPEAGEVQAMSVRFKFKVCEHINWEGDCEIFTYLGINGGCFRFPERWHHRVSSLSPIAEPFLLRCYFYEWKECSGLYVPLRRNEEASDLTKWLPGPMGYKDMNDVIMSVKCWKSMSPYIPG